MSLYYEAASLLANAERVGGSLKSRIYGRKDLKSGPAQVYALISEATRWSVVLKDVIDQTDLLKEERKLTPTLAVLLAHDLLLSKNGVAAPTNHVLKLAVTRHKARLNAELTRVRLRLGFGSVAALKDHIQATRGSGTDEHRHPRWVRINTLKTSLSEQSESSFKGYQRCQNFADLLNASPVARVYYIDTVIKDLLALPSGHDVSGFRAYNSGELILQDKASCFPAALLDPADVDGDIIDATAAPGNKTTHLAALLRSRANGETRSDSRIIAFERNASRCQTLRQMVKTAGAESIVSVRHKDFLAQDPKDEDMSNVRAILLDPSCSGSGIVGRDDESPMALPEAAHTGHAVRSARKRKHIAEKTNGDVNNVSQARATEVEQPLTKEHNQDPDALRARLEALSEFQLKILLHAMKFPNVRRITYSTCSTHTIENENVVLRALSRSISNRSGWRILHRDEQIFGLRDWPLRGDSTFCNDDVTAEACIKCLKGTAEGTMGFFVAGLIRDKTGTPEPRLDDEAWEGFGD